MKMLIDVPDNWKELLKANGHSAHMERTKMLTLAMAGSKEAIKVETPEGFSFSAIYDRGGKKSKDWESVSIYAVKED